MDRHSTARPTWPAEQRLVAWLDEQPRPPVVLARMARSIGALSRAVDSQAAGETLFKLQNARFVEFMADDAVTANEMDRRVRGDIALVLGQHLAAKQSIPA